MKTKTATKQRNQERKEVTAMKSLQKELSKEFTSVLDNSFLDELAFAEIDDYYYD